jgi:hypothetical protein
MEVPRIIVAIEVAFAGYQQFRGQIALKSNSNARMGLEAPAKLVSNCAPFDVF